MLIKPYIKCSKNILECLCELCSLTRSRYPSTVKRARLYPFSEKMFNSLEECKIWIELEIKYSNED